MKRLSKYKKIIQDITVFVGAVTFLWAIFSWYNQSTETSKKTQQMSLKSVIWNESIPVVERASACDDYLELGFNSYTKKFCENILKGVK